MQMTYLVPGKYLFWWPLFYPAGASRSYLLPSSVLPFATTVVVLAGRLQAVRHDGSGGRFVLVFDTNRHPYQHHGLGAGGLQVPGLREARRASVDTLLDLRVRLNSLAVSVLISDF